MFTVGDLIVNNQIQLNITNNAVQGEEILEVRIAIDSSPVGSNHTLTHSYRNIVNYFYTDTEGSYSAFATVTYRQFSTGFLRYENQSLSWNMTGQVFNQIEQTHTLVEATANPCGNVGVQVDTNFPFDWINGNSIPSTSSYVIDKARDEVLNIQIQATDYATHGQSTKLSAELAEFMPLNLSYDLNYLDITIENNNYEFDFGTGYQTLNYHHYDTEGTKSILVKDAYGCVRTIQIEAVAPPVIDPTVIDFTSYVSKANSLRFVKREGEFDRTTIYQTDENTFDSEVPFLDLRYCHTQRVKTHQDLRLQFQSSGETHVADLFDKDGVLQETLTINQVQSNIGFTDSRNYFRYDDEVYSYIYFSDGQLPYFYQIGATVTVNGEDRQILDLVYSDDLDVYALKLVKLTVATGGSIDYIYNKELYDIYEIELPLALRQAGEYYIILTISKTGETDIVYQTHPFEVADDFEQTVDITYYNQSNSDIYYQSGIKNYVTFGIEYRKPIADSQFNVVKGDATNFLRSSFLTEKFEIKFEPLTLEMMRKVEISLGHEMLIIDSTGYSCEGIEIETLDDNTNLYVITATVYKSNKNVRFIAGGTTPFDWSSGQVTFDSSITFDRTQY